MLTLGMSRTHELSKSWEDTTEGSLAQFVYPHQGGMLSGCRSVSSERLRPWLLVGDTEAMTKEVEPELKFPCLGLCSGRPHRALQRSLARTPQDIHH